MLGYPVIVISFPVTGARYPCILHRICLFVPFSTLFGVAEQYSNAKLL